MLTLVAFVVALGLLISLVSLRKQTESTAI